MLSLLAKASRQSLGPIRPLVGVCLPHRSYAFSRFPDRDVGTRRKRPTISSTRPTRESVEEESSVDESQLWRTSTRPPASDSREGLERLLLHDDTLIIERSAMQRII